MAITCSVGVYYADTEAELASANLPNGTIIACHDTLGTFRRVAGAWTELERVARKNAANGYGGLDGDGRVAAANLPTTPPAHASTHQSGGADAIKIDDLAAGDDNTDLNSSTSKHGLLRKLDGLTTTFLRGDGAWAAPTAEASVSATTVEVDLGTTAVWRGKFTITDAAIDATKKVLCWQAPGPYTGKGSRADEAELAPVQVLSVEPAAGSAVVKWRSVEGYTPILAKPRPLNQFVPVAASRDIVGYPQVLGVQARGLVRGNIKFTYTVMA